MSSPEHILVCTCRQAGLVEAEAAREIVRRLAAEGGACTVVEDLCAVAAGDTGKLAEAMRGVTAVAACRPRAVRWLLARAGVETGRLRFIDNRAEKAAGKTAEKTGQAGEWAAWFPVIDYDRCSGCGQCLEFCLFDVYERDEEGKVRVARPQRCKTNCPACARVCPKAAIIFPRYGASPFNGEEVPEGFLDKGVVDLKAKLGADPYAALRAREGGRFSTSPQAGGAAGGLAEALDIPAELLASGEAAALRAKLCGGECAAGRAEEDDEDENDCPCKGGR